jgi:hypothetical protein
LSQSKGYDYDLAFSFAGENRHIAKELSDLLSKKATVFYDDDFIAQLVGRVLTEEFKKIYGERSRYFIVIISEYYPFKDWTQFELAIGVKESKKRKEEFLIPIRLDDTIILGITNTIGHLDLRKISIDKAAEILLAKLQDNRLPHEIADMNTEFQRNKDYLISLLEHQGVTRFNAFRHDTNDSWLNLKQIDIGGRRIVFQKRSVSSSLPGISHPNIFSRRKLS